jgi:hypothetical protein
MFKRREKTAGSDAIKNPKALTEAYLALKMTFLV